jgi:hypothetical protein
VLGSIAPGLASSILPPGEADGALKYQFAFSLAVWLTATAIGVPTIAIWTRYYRRRLGVEVRELGADATRSATQSADRAS